MIVETLQNELNFVIDDVTPTEGKAVDKFKEDWKTSICNRYFPSACGHIIC